ncbi:MAG: Phosphorylase family protein [Parcubacteria group bacterium GW2011_GWC2_42_12]|nr:MAG: Phosphorylase family protein [Parcubacteria group bacterium GW2011_GWC2_42_12]
MYKQGIEVKRETNLGIVLETPFWFSMIEKLYPNCQRIFYSHSQDEVLHIKTADNSDIAFVADRGSSMSATITERLHIYGAKAIARVGTCGSLSKDVTLWRPIITTACYSDEGTSKHYLPSGFPIISDVFLNSLLMEALKKSQIRYQTGITITTDGRWREDVDLLKKLNQLGAISIEMDTAAILSVCQFRKIPASAINIPVDSPADEDNSNNLKGIPSEKNHRKKLERAFSLIMPVVIDTLTNYYLNYLKK